MKLFKSSKAEKLFPAEVRQQLNKIFDSLPREVDLFLFTDKGDQGKEIEIGRSLLEAFQEFSSKIRFQEYHLDHEAAARWQVDRVPAIVVSPEHYRIKYLGIPLGEETRTMVETIILAGTGQGRLSGQSLGVLERINEPRHVRVFVSPTCPYCPQEAVNAVKAAVEKPGLISVDIVDTAFNEDLVEKYQAYSVPQAFANEVLIGRGAQPEELFLFSLEQLEQQNIFIPSSTAELVETDLVIIGGGPAGLTAGIYAARSGLRAVIVERNNLGGQVATTPVVENYPGLAHVGGKSLVDVMVAHALEYVSVFPREEVLEIKTGQPIEIQTSLRRFVTRAVLFATGASHKTLGVPGETRFAGRGVSYCSTCDGPLFKGGKVALVGGGNSAVTEALHLNHIGVDVTLIHRRDSLRAQERLVQDLISKNIPILWNTEVREIRGQEKVRELVLYNNQSKQTETMPVDGLFVAIGYEPATVLARKTGLELTAEGYIKQDGQHRTNQPGFYSAGDVEGGYKQIVTAAGAGAAAAMVIFEDLAHPYWKRDDRNL